MKDLRAEQYSKPNDLIYQESELSCICEHVDIKNADILDLSSANMMHTVKKGAFRWNCKNVRAVVFAKETMDSMEIEDGAFKPMPRLKNVDLPENYFLNKDKEQVAEEIKRMGIRDNVTVKCGDSVVRESGKGVSRTTLQIEELPAGKNAENDLVLSKVGEKERMDLSDFKKSIATETATPEASRIKNAKKYSGIELDSSDFDISPLFSAISEGERERDSSPRRSLSPISIGGMKKSQMEKNGPGKG